MPELISGQCAPALRPLRDAFETNFADDLEVGASLCVYVGGECLVDLWGGYSDQAQTTTWQSDTMVNLYSATKGVAALAFAKLTQSSKLDFDSPVADYWPELEAGRDGLSIGALLAHKGGLCGLSTPVRVADLYAWEQMIERLNTQTPHWQPGTAVGYHAILWGYLPGELCRRVAGTSLGKYVAQQMSADLTTDFYIGLPPAQHQRIAPMVGPNRARRQPNATTTAEEVGPLNAIAMANPLIRAYQDASSPAWQAAEIAAANGQGNARGLARLYAACLDPEFVSKETIARLCQLESGETEPDLVLGYGLNRGRGLILNTRGEYGPNAASFGHTGAGGSIAFVDPERQLAFGYAMNQMQTGEFIETRRKRLIDAVYACIA